MSSPKPISSSPKSANDSTNSRRGSMAGSPFRQASLRLGSPVTVGSFSQRSLGPGTGASPAAVSDFDDNVFSTDRRSFSLQRKSFGNAINGGVSSGLATSLSTSNAIGNSNGNGTGNGSGNGTLSRAMSSSSASPSNLLGSNIPGSSAVSISDQGSSIIDIDNPDPEIVKVVGRHLVREARGSDFGSDYDGSVGLGSNDGLTAGTSNGAGGNGTAGIGNRATDVVDDDDKFMSLRLQGGDITRQLYNWQREHEEGDAATKRGRSRSFDLPRPAIVGPDGHPIDTKNIKAPGGFRRNFISHNHQTRNRHDPESQNTRRPAFLTRNFIEFLSIYGHFAGEELEDDEDEDDEEDGAGSPFGYGGIGGASVGGSGGAGSGGNGNGDEEQDQDETSALISRPRLSRKKSAHHGPGNATQTKAVMLLLKSFVGTGVLFLPKAYSNGGLLFCSVLLVFVSLISYWCFLLLIESKNRVGGGSFGDIGGVLYGPRMRQLILFSIVISQIGFAAAYIVFVSENLQAFVMAVTNNQTFIRVEVFIFLQLIVFLPLSMIRDIAKLSGTALVADFFILLGLVYLYYYGAHTIAEQGVADVVMFNSESWTLFIGTAIFTYEGIGLIIPIQESMKHPQKFTPVLAGVMVGITLVFVSMGALQYAAYGTKVKTVIILNLPQDSHFVNGVQFLYSAAILLSTPLQLFPAIRIMENWLFVRSGKYNTKIKWQKNVFRFFLTFLTALVAWGGADDLDKFVALIGSFACIPLVYIYPPLLHLKAVKQSWYMVLADVVLAVAGLGAMIYTTAGTVSSWIKS
ncbi:Avt3p [Sugiyamaella lignohabitans]|uniref:Avt3p n=1 Tax=Sugiyamaella lignohabitans TaxID=796027 RepID=A0A167E803_9ASCO|nr:Avt3p [Sugiyamaella lignohabitans]ANB13753.1 Avt3p [Sugiyamaella lignohabitans]